MHTPHISLLLFCMDFWMMQVAEDLKQQLASANLKAEQLQVELTSQQRSSETSVEALAIEHKCTKDNMQVCAHTVLLLYLIHSR